MLVNLRFTKLWFKVIWCMCFWQYGHFIGSKKRSKSVFYKVYSSEVLRSVLQKYWKVVSKIPEGSLTLWHEMNKFLVKTQPSVLVGQKILISYWKRSHLQVFDTHYRGRNKNNSSVRTFLMSHYGSENAAHHGWAAKQILHFWCSRLAISAF